MRVAFAGGGTGGHLYPAVAIAGALELLEPGSDVLFLGSDRPLERRILGPTGYLHVALPAAPWRTSLRGLLNFGWEQLCGFFAARTELKAFGADALVGLGGFVSVPGVLAARSLGVPVALFEPNAVPGRANEVLAHLAEEAYVHWAQTELACARVRCGTPLDGRALAASNLTVAAARERLGLKAGVPTVLVMGGSQGAKRINEWVLRSLPELRACAAFIHLAGTPEAAAQLEAAYAAAGCDAFVTHFMSDIGIAYRAADVAVVRAGAATLAELLAAGLPALAVPMPNSAGDHQRHNAAAFAATGAGTWIEEADLKPEVLACLVAEADDGRLLDARRRAAEVAARPDAARKVAQHVRRLARRDGAVTRLHTRTFTHTQRVA